MREVLEETGIGARIIAPAGTSEHQVTLVEGSVTKRVHWFLMRPSDPVDPTAPSTGPTDDEVDIAAWWPHHVALTELTYESERQLLLRTVTAGSDDGTDH